MNMKQGLVSIITPCYNTGGIVHRLLDSILEQDYPYVEMYAVDDGSTDNTFEVLNSYKPRFERRGYSLVCVKQENQGQSSAVNNALKHVSGEFLTWPDSDDYYKRTDALSSFVKALKTRSDKYAMVRCPPTYVSEDGIHIRTANNVDMSTCQFDNCLYNKNFMWTNYMVRMSAFDKCNPQRDIYVEKNAGQNWQMLLPVLYKYKCHTLPDSYFCVLERAASHSRGQYKGYEQQILRITSYCNTIHHTLERMSMMPLEEKCRLQRAIRIQYLWKMWACSVGANRKEEKVGFEAELKRLVTKFSLKRRVMLICGCNRTVYRIAIKLCSMLGIS